MAEPKKETTRQARQATDETAESTRDAATRATHRAGEATQRTGDKVGEATREAEKTGDKIGEAASRATEKAARETQETMGEAGHKIERLSERQGETVKRSVREATDTTERLTMASAGVLNRSGGAVAKGMQDVGRTWLEYIQDAMRQNMEATESLLRCRTFSDIVQAQSDYMRHSLDAMLEKSARISDISARMLAESTQSMAQLAGRDRDEHEHRDARR